MTSKRGSVVSNSLTSRSRSSASMMREARSSRIHSRSFSFGAESAPLTTSRLPTAKSPGR